MLGELGGEKQIELACLKTGMGWCDWISAGSASTIDDGKNQGIGNRPGAEVEIKESSELDHWSTGNRHAVSPHVNVRRLGYRGLLRSGSCRGAGRGVCWRGGCSGRRCGRWGNAYGGR